MCSACPTIVISDNLYLLGESSNSPTSMGSQPTVMFVKIMAQITTLTQTVSEVRKDQQAGHERLAKIDTAQEPLKIEETPLSPNDSRHAPNHDYQYLKSIKLDVPTIDGSHDPQLFLDWLQQLDRYFT